jgi:hypothetical protein
VIGGSRFAADIDGLREYCRRAGLVHKVNRQIGVLAVFHRLLDRDAPLFVRVVDWNVVIEIAMPFSVRPGRRDEVAARVAALGPGWELRGNTIVYSSRIYGLGGLSDEAMTAALDDVRDRAAAAAKELEALSQP